MKFLLADGAEVSAAVWAERLALAIADLREDRGLDSFRMAEKPGVATAKLV